MRFSLAQCSFFALALAACIGGGDDANYNISGSFEVVAIDRAAGTITTRSTSYECDEAGNTTSEVQTTVSRYVIKDGKLTLWEVGECDAQILNGASGDIVGTWKATGLEASQPIPAEYRPATCPAEIPVDSSADFLDDLSVTFKISETKIDLSASGNICMGEAMAAEMVADGFTIVSKSCDKVVLKDPLGNQMVVNTSLKGNTMGVSLTYQGRTCGFSMDMPMPGKPIDCKKQKESMDGYLACLQGLAGPAPVANALRKAAASIQR